MASENSNNFDEVLAQLKRGHKVTTSIITFFSSLYSRIKEMESQKSELAMEIKVALLRTKEMIVAPPDSPYMLELTVTDPKPVTTTTVNWEAIARLLAERVYGKEYEKNTTWYKSVEKGTTSTTRTAESQVRLNPPKLNPNYKKLL